MSGSISEKRSRLCRLVPFTFKRTCATCCAVRGPVFEEPSVFSVVFVDTHGECIRCPPSLRPAIVERTDQHAAVTICARNTESSGRGESIVKYPGMDLPHKGCSTIGSLDHATDFTSGLTTGMICPVESEVPSNHRYRCGTQPISKSLPYGIRVKILNFRTERLCAGRYAVKRNVRQD